MCMLHDLADFFLQKNILALKNNCLVSWLALSSVTSAEKVNWIYFNFVTTPKCAESERLASCALPKRETVYQGQRIPLEIDQVKFGQTFTNTYNLRSACIEHL